MNSPQPGILAPIPPLARYLHFYLRPGVDPRNTLQALQDRVDGEQIVVGMGKSLVQALGTTVPGLHTFPGSAGNGVEVPATPYALWCWLRGTDRGELLHQSRQLRNLLAEDFELVSLIDAFKYGVEREIGLDLTGYEDGTENPQGAEALTAGTLQNPQDALHGSSFVAVQHWVHNLDAFSAKSQPEQDHIFGRRQSDNEELDDAPESAHVKRTAQEDFTPEAFVLRRSMPWTNGDQDGLVFTAFGHSFAAFEALLKRMTGEEDGISDALFTISRPISGSYFWCPPIKAGRLDLSAVGL